VNEGRGSVSDKEQCGRGSWLALKRVNSGVISQKQCRGVLTNVNSRMVAVKWSESLLPFFQCLQERLFLPAYVIGMEFNLCRFKIVGLPSKKTATFLRPVKDDLSLKTPGVYSIPCECLRSTLDKPDFPLIPRSRSSTNPSAYINPTNEPWPNAALTRVTASSFKATASWPWYPDARNASSGKR
jgi:hypothetical protein